jgi:hypothetical protein
MKAVREPADAKRVALDALTATGELVRYEDYDAALKTILLAANAAMRSGNRHIATVCSGRKDEVVEIVRQFKDVSNDFERLKESPTSTDANLAVGRFLCLIVGNWEKGLPMLLRSGNSRYETVAQVELSLPKTPDAQTLLGRMWKYLADGDKPPWNGAMYARAYHWYQMALRGSSGQMHEQVSSLLGELPMRYLTDMKPFEVKPGPWPFANYGDAGSGSPIVVNGFESPNGLGLHPPDNGFANAKFKLDGAYLTFTTGVALNDANSRSKAEVYFLVFGDGRLLWKSSAIAERGQVDFCKVSVKNVRTLELRTMASGSAHGAHAVWLDPLVTK